MSEHTKEPWHVCENVHIASEDGNGYWISICTDVNTPANARRIVACVNVMSGIRTEFLEKFSHAPAIERIRICERLEKQRDELLAALVEIADGGARNTPRNSKCEHGQYSFQPCEQCIEEFARQAIAAAKGTET